MNKTAGLTLVEILIVLGILAILLGLGTIVFTGFARQDRIEAVSGKIVAVLGEARAKTLAGYSYGGGSSLNFGVYFAANSYTLFSGVSFNPDDPANQEFSFSSDLIIDQILLPSSNIIFEKITGEVDNFNPDQNYIILIDSRSDQERKISVNKLGVVGVE